MNTFIALFALIASSTASAPAPADGGFIKLDRIGTVASARQPKFAAHVAKAPTMRRPEEVRGGCVTRTLEGDASGQKVTYCN